MLWSAYGDALGFITELADERGISIRTGGVTRVERLMPWRRRVGGKYGQVLDLPAGIYSDDTQLRLAVCRCIREGGLFDAEAFAKVELPVFLSYCLGAGLSTKAAAESLRRQNIQWNTNFFESGRISYLKAGGNGVAMRIQPHVWACREYGKTSDLLLGVIQNTIVSHGHCGALIGACFHALTLNRTLLGKEVPSPQEWPRLLEELRDLSTCVQNDDELNTMWLPAWERLAGQPFPNAFSQALEEFLADIQRIISRIDVTAAAQDYVAIYQKCVSDLGCFDRKYIGSATKTALLANLVAYLYRHKPHAGIITAVNAFGSDTDTIATMAGAIMGLVADSSPPENPLDQEYLLGEAQRLADIGLGNQAVNHPYPDLSLWKPPRTNVDCVGVDGKDLYLKGFGKLELLASPVGKERDKSTFWQQCRLPWGQTVIVQRRAEPKEILQTDKPALASKHIALPTPTIEVKGVKVRDLKESTPQRNLFSGYFPGGRLSLQKDAGINECDDKTIENLLGRLAKEGYPVTILGEELLSMALYVNGIEKAVSFACRTVKAMQDTKIVHSGDISKKNLHEMTAEAINSGLRASLIGGHLRQLAASEATYEIVAAYSGIISKALIVRRDRRNGNLVRPTQFTKERQ